MSQDTNLTSPAVMFIESAADELRRGNLPQWLVESQRKELHSFGDVRAQQLGASGLTEDFIKGYELGLETARTLLAMNPKARTNGVGF